MLSSFYVNGNRGGTGNFDKLRKRAGTSALSGRKRMYPHPPDILT